MLLSVHRTSRWALLLAACLLSLYMLYTLHANDYLLPSWTPEVASDSPLLSEQRSFWQRFYPKLIDYQPQCKPIAHSGNGDLSIGYDASDHERQRPDNIVLSQHQASKLRIAHEGFVDHLRHEGYRLPFTPKTRGIVTTAGGKYLPVALLSIRMLRITGSRLPVEVFLASQDEWDPQICESLFPSLNANCVVLDDIFSTSRRKKHLKIDKYQYKIMSIVFSSFEEVLFLDSDCFPISDPNKYFDSEPFLSTGMIRWPDFWFPSESPRFFEIAGIPEPGVWESSATESGELFYSKGNHTNSLLLALYYNYYGPNFYYPLQSQGAPGEGDKETFVWSARVLNETFYSVHQRVRALGYRTTAGEWRGSAMAQGDPIEDYERNLHVKPGSEDKSLAEVRPLFLHVNFPKLDPGSIFDDMSFGAIGPTKDADGTLRRIWHDTQEKAVEFFGFDLERKVWEIVRELACEHEDRIIAWQGKTAVCETATTYWNTVFG